MEEYKDKASFEEFFKQNYVPLDYKSIRNEMREAAGDGWSLFTDEYKFRGKIFDNDTAEIYFDTIEKQLKEMLDALYDDVLKDL